MAETLKSFLVSYGFAVDTASQAKTEAGVKRTEAKNTATTQAESDKRVRIDKAEEDKKEKLANEVEKKDRERRARGFKEAQAAAVKMTAFAIKTVAAVEATALGVTYAVDRAAKSFERLNYVSQRAGTTAAGTTAFGYASSQLGSSVEAGQSQLQGFGQLLKQPGYRQALQRLLRKNITDARGNLTESTEDLASDLGDRLRAMQQEGPNGYARAMAQAGMYGFDMPQTQAMMDPRFRGLEAQRRLQQGEIGADPNAAAQSGTAFEVSMRHFVSVVDDIATKIETSLFKSLQPQLEALARWATDNGARIADFVTTIADGITKLAVAFAQSTLVQEAVKGLASGLETFTKLVGSDDFRKDVRGFVQDVTALARAIRSALEWLGILPSRSTSAEPGSAIQAQPGDGLGGLMNLAHRGRKDFPSDDKVLGKLNNFRSGKGVNAAPDPPAPYSADEFGKEVGVTAAQYGAVREGIAGIEGARYNQMGGSSGRFAGRYQMGQAEISETARSLGINAPSTQQFLNDPKMQEQFFERYTLNHYRQMMRDPRFAALPTEKKLQMLGYAHNQGVGGALSYLNSGREGRDAFGTSGTAYIHSIGQRLSSASNSKNPLGALGAFDKTKAGSFGALDKGSFSAGPLTSTSTSTRGDTSLTHNPTFNIYGPNIDQSMSAARIGASRGWQDTLRNLQGAEQ